MTISARFSLATLVIGMLAFAAGAEARQGSRQLVCPALLTEQECLVYHAEKRQARSARARTLLETRYADLLRERALLCPPAEVRDVAAATEDGPNPRPGAQRRISM